MYIKNFVKKKSCKKIKRNNFTKKKMKNFKILPFRITIDILRKYYIFSLASSKNIKEKDNNYLWDPCEKFLLEFYGYFSMDKQRKIFFIFKNITNDYDHLSRISWVYFEDESLKKFIPNNLECLCTNGMSNTMLPLFIKKKLKMVKSENHTYRIDIKTVYIKSFKVSHGYRILTPASLSELIFCSPFFDKIVICKGCTVTGEFFEFFKKNYHVDLFNTFPKYFQIKIYKEDFKNTAIKHFREDLNIDLLKYNQNTNLITDIYDLFFQKGFEGNVLKDILIKKKNF